MQGLTQDAHPLTLQHVLGRMRDFHPEVACVSVTEVEPVRTTFGAIAARVDRMASALRQLGICPGDRVATLAWNTVEHFEAYLAVPCIGAVLHTLNARLSAEQLAQIVADAEDRVLVVDRSLLDLAGELLSRVSSVEHVIVLGADDDAGMSGALGGEMLIAAADGAPAYPHLDDRWAAGLCYTSGTTGMPKGVLYSHRALVLHSLALGNVDTFAIGTRERALPVVPMFHANAWGIPYAAGMLGAELVLPNRFLAPDELARLIESERPTLAAGVPTVWHGLLRHADKQGSDLSSLKRIFSGGAPMPRRLMEAFEQRHGVELVQTWGMTETAPVGAVALPPAGASGQTERDLRCRAGRLLPLLDMRIVGDDGTALPWDDMHHGELEVRGPWIAVGYYGGDIARINDRGCIAITDRAKDLVKSGGEWISSVELEDHLMSHPKVAEAAVVARDDVRWGERPVALIVPEADAEIGSPTLLDHLRGLVPRWWLPDERDVHFVDALPRTSVGKLDKRAIRSRLTTAGSGEPPFTRSNS